MKLRLLITIIIIVVLAAAGGVYYFNNQKQTAEPAPLSPATSEPANQPGAASSSPATSTKPVETTPLAPINPQPANSALPKPVGPALPAPIGPGAQKPTACLKAGEATTDASFCCPGLVMIFKAYYSPDESCEELGRMSKADGTLYSICSACGNGKCEAWENRCNCPKDCHFL